MLDALNRTERYRELAEECRRLAATSLSTQMRTRYSRMAEDYSKLALVEGRTGLHQLAALLSHGLATLTAEKVRAGGKLMAVVKVWITEAGRHALAGDN